MAAEGGAGVDDPELAKLLVDHWDWVLRTSPVWATTLGDHRFDSELADDSKDGIDSERARRRIFLTRAKAMGQEGLSESDRRTYDLFVDRLESQIATEVCQMELWSISARGNPLTEFNVLPEMHKVETLADGRALLARYRKIARSIDDSIANLRRGIDAQLIANARSAALTAEMIDKQLEAPLPEWPLSRIADDLPGSWPAAERKELAATFRKVVADEIRPALDRYRRLLVEQIIPNARDAEHVGLVHLPQGRECYQAQVRYYTGLSLPPQSLHELGLEKIAEINAEMRALGEELFGTDDLAKITDRLRTDQALYFDTEEAIVAVAEEAVARARAAIPSMFGVLPKSKVVVVPIPDYEAPYTTIAYYRQPHADGSKPGEYYINTYKPEVRPRYEMEVLAYHEAIPGHHLQIAIGQERSELPAFRRHTGNTAFVEGWALYTERLADEHDLYSGKLDRMGMLSYDAWRASRLVVDTGIHHLGWTRGQAEEFMAEHTALTRDNIANEVDRYITWPGQALAYKVGQLTILELRETAKKQLGDAFDLRGFHDAVLTHGAVSLPVLKKNVAAWVAERKEAATRSSGEPTQSNRSPL